MSLPPAPRKRKGWMSLTIHKILPETPDTLSFYLRDDDEKDIPFDYIAGQYLTIRYDTVTEKPVVRSYTMSSSPSQKGYCVLTVKRVEGGLISNWMCDNLKIGDILKARGPIGKFCYHEGTAKSHLIMVAAGSGVTPFISILREYTGNKHPTAPAKMTLLVAYRTTEDIICREELEKFQKHEEVKIIITLTREETDQYHFGRPTQEMLDRFLNIDESDTTIMTCGPEAMMDMVTDWGGQKGIIEEQILTESF
ncbi:MAG: hypothetical protein CMP10_15305 [Zetaproteobacteria bacterium]|nr:hypothetical protein [Pseudobdellovibrionaceae bacterium]